MGRIRVKNKSNVTKKKITELQKRLVQYMKERGMSKIAQELDFKINYSKRLTEYYEAKRLKSKSKMIKALCLMSIVCLCARKPFSLTRLEEMRRGCSNFEDCNVQNVLISGGFEECIVGIERMGYDPHLCILETIKELESHTGAICEIRNEWKEDLGAYNALGAKSDFTDYFASSLSQKALFFNGFGVIDVEVFNDHFVVRYHNNGREEEFKMTRWYEPRYDECVIPL